MQAGNGKHGHQAHRLLLKKHLGPLLRKNLRRSFLFQKPGGFRLPSGQKRHGDTFAFPI
jgi:hypothetical protein